MKNSTFLLFTFFVFVYTSVFGQHHNIAAPPNILNVENGITLVNQTNNSFEYIASNIYYDVNGNEVFHIEGRSVKEPDYTTSNPDDYFLVGDLKSFYDTPDGLPTDPNDPWSVDPKDYTNMGREVSIVPIPGECQKFYIIYTMHTYFSPGGVVLYMVLDCSGGSSQLLSPSGVGSVHHVYPINYAPNGGIGGSGLAVSKVINAQGHRYLFYGGYADMSRVTITENSFENYLRISSGLTDLELNYATSFSGELDLSPDQMYLGWALNHTVDGGVNLIELSPDYEYQQSFHKKLQAGNGNGLCQGFEFVPNTDEFLVCGDDGVWRGTRSNNAVINDHRVSSPVVVNSFIEYYDDSKLFLFIGEDEQFYSMDLTLVSLNPESFYTPSNAPGYADFRLFSLNDQVDGEDYSYFNGQPKKEIDFAINGVPASPFLQTLVLCPNDVISLNELSSGMKEYRIGWQYSNSSGVPTGQINWSSWLSAFPTDLSPYINTSAGYYHIYVEGKSGCGAVSLKKAFISINYHGLASASMSFDLDANNDASTCSSPYLIYTCHNDYADYSVQQGVSSTNSFNHVLVEIDYSPSDDCNSFTHQVDNFDVVDGNYNLFTQTSPYNFDINPGLYRITLTPINICGQEGTKIYKYFTVGSTPVGASAVFETKTELKLGTTYTVDGCTSTGSQYPFLYSTLTPQCSLSVNNGIVHRVAMEEISHLSPNPVGRNTTNLDFTQLNNGTGNATNTVRVYTDKWDGTQWVNLNVVNSYDVSHYGSVNLRSLLQGETVNFDDPNTTPSGSVYKLRVQVHNVCDYVEQIQIITIDEGNFYSPLSNQAHNSHDVLTISASPNPAENEIMIEVQRLEEMESDSFENEQLEIIDMQGRVVVAAKSAQIQKLDNGRFRVSLNDLVAGIYQYRYSWNGNVRMARIVKK
jgi:hypothetical protein